MTEPESATSRGKLTVMSVSRAFGAVRAIDDVSFTVEPARITGLIGPNGAGKTTLFNAIAGEVAVDAGQVTLDGTVLSGLPPHRVFAAGLTRTFQIPRPFSKLSVLENLLLVPHQQLGETFWTNWLRRPAVARQERANLARAREIADFCNLNAVIDQPAGLISGGQQKLVELARSLIAEPRIILLDEPGAGVNPALLDTIVDRIRALNRDGMTFLIIEHNMDFITALCDRLVVMSAGRKLAEGSPDEVTARPDVAEAYLGGVPA